MSKKFKITGIAEWAVNTDKYAADNPVCLHLKGLMAKYPPKVLPYECEAETEAGALAKFCEKFGLKRFSRKRAYKIAEGEIATLNQYVNGEVFGYVEQTRATREDEWEDGDSCWGFFGKDSIPDMLTDAGADEEGTVVCEDSNAYVGMGSVTMKREIPGDTHTEVKAA